MGALMVSRIRVKDPAKLEEYLKKTRALATPLGAEIVAATKPVGQLNGEPDHDRLIIVKFPDMERINSLFSSDDYKPLIALREEAADMHMTTYELAG